MMAKVSEPLHRLQQLAIWLPNPPVVAILFISLEQRPSHFVAQIGLDFSTTSFCLSSAGVLGVCPVPASLTGHQLWRFTYVLPPTDPIHLTQSWEWRKMSATEPFYTSSVCLDLDFLFENWVLRLRHNLLPYQKTWMCWFWGQLHLEGDYLQLRMQKSKLKSVRIKGSCKEKQDEMPPILESV